MSDTDKKQVHCIALTMNPPVAGRRATVSTVDHPDLSSSQTREDRITVTSTVQKVGLDEFETENTHYIITEWK